MAIYYNLEFATDLTPAEVLDDLARRPGLRRTESDGLYGHGLYITASEISGLGCVINKEAFGIDVNTNVSFRCDGVEDECRDRSIEEIVRSSIELVRRMNADAVLLINYEKPLLLHRGGQLILDSAAAFFWEMPDHLSWVTGPYTMQILPER
jgi:hypothetical protein